MGFFYKRNPEEARVDEEKKEKTYEDIKEQKHFTEDESEIIAKKAREEQKASAKQ